jgi:hypothetical protein
MVDVRIREVPEQFMVGEQRLVDQAALEDWLPGAMARVGRTAEDLGAMTGTSSFPYLRRDAFADEPVFVVIYEGNPNDGEVPVEVCATLTPQGNGWTGPGRRHIPAHREAYVRVSKDDVQSGRLGQVYQAIQDWIGSQGLQIGGAPRETYWTDFHAAGPQDEVFDVSWPIA